MLVLMMKLKRKQRDVTIYFILLKKILCAFMSLGKLPVSGHVPSEDQRSTLQKLP